MDASSNSNARIFFSVHEMSGDFATAELINELRRRVPRLHLFGFGGPNMRQAGVELWDDTTTHARMGLFEILTEIPRLLRHIHDTAQRVVRLRPDVVIVADAPDFNIRLAKAIKQQNPAQRIVYYLAPQIWGWRTGRVSQLRKYFDARLCLLPFEPRWYACRYTTADYIGHPSVDRVAGYLATSPGRAALRQRFGLAETDVVLAILPGSRRKVIRYLLPVQLAALARLNAKRKAAGLPRVRGIVAGAPSQPVAFYEPFQLGPATHTRLAHPSGETPAVAGNSFDVCAAADLAVVCSGTATIETALLDTPQVVVYRGNWLSAQIVRALVTVKFVSLVNLIAGREVVHERLQEFCTPSMVATDLEELCHLEARQRIRHDYQMVRDRLGPPGAARRAAEIIAARFVPQSKL